jgi:hypothetical protein
MFSHVLCCYWFEQWPFKQVSQTLKDEQLTNCLHMASWCNSDMIFISRVFHGLMSFTFHGQLENGCM